MSNINVAQSVETLSQVRSNVDNQKETDEGSAPSNKKNDIRLTNQQNSAENKPSPPIKYQSSSGPRREPMATSV